MATKRLDFTQVDALSDYICDYLDSTMDRGIAEVFEEYMASKPELAAFVRSAKSGMNALSLLRDPSIEEDGR
jgi:hypothetical protein